MYRYICIFIMVALYVASYYKGPVESWTNRGGQHISFSMKSSPSGHKEGPFYREGFIHNDDGKAVHVSSITPLAGKRMITTWYAGTREGSRDVSIYYSVYNEDRSEWTAPQPLVTREQASMELDRYIKKVGNALIYNDGRGSLWLFYATVTVGGWSGTSLNYKVSIDEGMTWSESRKLVLSPFLNLTNNVKNKGITFEDGSLIIPVYHEFLNKYSQILRIMPYNNDILYRIEKMTHGRKAIQPSLLYNNDGSLVAFFRNMGPKKGRYILVSRSDDSGQSWSGLSDTELPHPNAGFDMIQLDSGSYLGVVNNSFSKREKLALVISHDRGETWETLHMLEDLKEYEFSYPSISRSDSGRYHVTYTYNRRRIKHVEFNDAWIDLMEGVEH